MDELIEAKESFFKDHIGKLKHDQVVAVVIDGVRHDLDGRLNAVHLPYDPQVPYSPTGPFRLPDFGWEGTYLEVIVRRKPLAHEAAGLSLEMWNLTRRPDRS